jgi:cytidine deaminase
LARIYWGHPCVPCGACLQVIAEFSANPSIYLVDKDGHTPLALSLESLLPRRFDAAELRDRAKRDEKTP